MCSASAIILVMQCTHDTVLCVERCCKVGKIMTEITLLLNSERGNATLILSRSFPLSPVPLHFRSDESKMQPRTRAFNSVILPVIKQLILWIYIKDLNEFQILQSHCSAILHLESIHLFIFCNSISITQSITWLVTSNSPPNTSDELVIRCINA
jgi:hypothetical protein